MGKGEPDSVNDGIEDEPSKAITSTKGILEEVDLDDALKRPDDGRTRVLKIV